MSDPSICPVRRDRCRTVEVCWLINCAAQMARAPGVKMRPMHERELTKAERYRLHMAEQKAEASRHG